MAGRERIDWDKYDPMILAGTPANIISDEADRSRQSVQTRMRKLGIRTRPYKKRPRVAEFTADGVFNYWGWLQKAIKELGKAEVIRRYGYR